MKNRVAHSHLLSTEEFFFFELIRRCSSSFSHSTWTTKKKKNNKPERETVNSKREREKEKSTTNQRRTGSIGPRTTSNENVETSFQSVLLDVTTYRLYWKEICVMTRSETCLYMTIEEKEDLSIVHSMSRGWMRRSWTIIRHKGSSGTCFQTSNLHFHASMWQCLNHSHLKRISFEWKSTFSVNATCS